MSVGYSGTPLARKLGIKAGHRVGTFNAPSHFPDLLATLPDDVRVEAEPATDVPLDVAVLFVTDLRGSHVRVVGLEAGLVDNKVCGVDEDRSSLRFVYRLSDR